MIALRGSTADEVWQAMMSRLQGETASRDSRAGKTRELLHLGFTIDKPACRWITARRPPLNPAIAVADLVWTMRGRKDASFVNFFNPALPRYAGSAHTYHGAYGFRLRKHFGVDQLARAADALASVPESRQVVLQLWDPAVDLPADQGSPRSPDIPCNISAMLKMRDGKLEWMQVVRSSDVYRGIPYDIALFTSLQEVLAGWIGVRAGAYHQLSDSLHLYERDALEVAVGESLDSAMEADTLAVAQSTSAAAFVEIERWADLLVGRRGPDVVESESLGAVELHGEYRNLLAVLWADACRRYRRRERAMEAIAECTNSCMRELWTSWAQRADARARLE